MINGSVIATETLSTIPLSGWQFYGGQSTGNITVTSGVCPQYPPLSVTIISNNNSCRGITNCDGAITVSAQGGLSPYYYSINNGVTTQTSPTFNNLCPNNYIVTVYDSIGNTQSSTVTIGYDSNPVTYQLSVVDFGTPIQNGIPNQSNTLTKTYKVQSNPPIPVGTSVSFNLTFSNTKTYDGPGNGTIDKVFAISKNSVIITPTFVSNTPVVMNRPNCSPNTQTGVTQTNSVQLTMTSTDDVLITCTSELNLTNPLGSAQTNCTTKLTQSITSNITQVSVIGNECSTAVGGSRTVLEHSITYIPVVIPPPQILVHQGFGSGANLSLLCDPNWGPFANLYSYASDGLSPAVGITIYQSRGINNVLSNPISSVVTTNCLGWNGGQRYLFTVTGAPGVITTITPCS